MSNSNLTSAQELAVSAFSALPGLEAEGYGGMGFGSHGRQSWTLAIRPMSDTRGRPTLEGWRTFEWVTWLTHDIRSADNFLGRLPRLSTRVYAPPPWLNERGRCFWMLIEGNDSTMTLTDLATDLVRLWGDPGCGDKPAVNFPEISV